MLAETTELSQIRDYVVKVLPQLLRESPEIVTTIEGMVAQQFPRRDEFARLLEEVKSLRQEMIWRLELQRQELQQRMDLLRQDMEQRINLLRKEMEQRLAQVDKHLEQVDNRLEQIDKRLAQIDKHLEQVDNRLEQQRQEMERRFEAVDRRLAQIDKHLEQVDKRLEQQREEMERRFAEVDKRFEQVDKRFEQVDQQLANLRQDNLHIKRDIVKLQAGQESILKQLAGQDAWLRMTVGDLRNEKGQSLEDMFAAGLRHGLKDDEISPDTIRLRQPLEDIDGLVFKKGYGTEVDLIAQNGKLTVFEVKATAKVGEVDLFAWKVELVKAQNPTLQVRGVFICLGAPAAVKQRCLENGLELLD
jgi:chromosome segregation ATPase